MQTKSRMRRVARPQRKALTPTLIKIERRSRSRSPVDTYPAIRADRHAAAGNASGDEYEDQADDFTDWAGFEVSRALPRCDERRYTLQDLMALLDTPNGIDLNPEYQRDFVWNAPTQTGLIDSILQGYYIPSLIFNRRSETVLGVRKDALVCLDGKQRLTSVKRFTDGHIPCHDRHGRKWWFCRAAGEKCVRSRKYLPASAKAELWKKTFLCHQYVGMTIDQERDLFQRVQRGSPLTPAERAQAKSGAWQSLARTFQKDYPRIIRLCDSARGRGYDNLVSSFVQIVAGEKDAMRSEIPFRGTGTWTERYFVKDVEQYPCTTNRTAHLRNVFDRFDELARLQPRTFATDSLGTRPTLAPVEFIATAYLISRYSTRSNAEIEVAIRTMRHKVQQDHKDNVRRKPMVWRTLVESMRESFRTQDKNRPPLFSQDQAQRKVRQLFGLE
ncbi:unnamed protein product [Zymoseptoria tritici ST99CH_1E4]|uniref:GmrSD restriction endonucleases N-terminal domain-containing protein n=1 Tax=Zymoseptoria tritici ST99CH_1E4 TaxID=1276532 RepID=A0A2H1GSP9_ZYMTR|nr:unnamed protein product [Zymoseptoria tritici ST99CH_1E4]